jgi:hypothetical protein
MTFEDFMAVRVQFAVFLSMALGPMHYRWLHLRGTNCALFRVEYGSNMFNQIAGNHPKVYTASQLIRPPPKFSAPLPIVDNSSLLHKKGFFPLILTFYSPW